MSRGQWGIVFVAGMGFFTDAYDLFIIGVVATLLAPLWHLSTLQIALLSATALVSAAIGSIVFGRIADRLGRKVIYGFEVLVLGLGALASAFAPNIWVLMLFRFCMGLGIGGDYPVSATIASEFAGKRSRGLMISSVFAMQGLGLCVGPLLAILLLQMHVPSDIVWRVLLAAGALPPLAVFWARRSLRETPRFEQLARNSEDEAARGKASHGLIAAIRTAAGAQPEFGRRLLGAAAAWFLLDLAYYGNTISNQSFVRAVDPQGSAVHNLAISLAVFACAALPGYLVAAFGMDRLGRKTIQIGGFAVMAVTFAAIALLGDPRSSLAVFVALYGVNYFFAEFGPNTTTFVFPAELFPVRVRTTAHGLTATVGKAGAAVGTFGFPLLQHAYGLPGPMWLAAGASLAGIIVTVFLLPETKGLSLEEASRESGYASTGTSPHYA